MRDTLSSTNRYVDARDGDYVTQKPATQRQQEEADDMMSEQDFEHGKEDEEFHTPEEAMDETLVDKEMLMAKQLRAKTYFTRKDHQHPMQVLQSAIAPQQVALPEQLRASRQREKLLTEDDRDLGLRSRKTPHLQKLEGESVRW